MSNTTMGGGAAGRAVVAVDLGAESCRVSLLQWDGQQAGLETMHRFRNAPLEEEGHLCWDLARIRAGIEEGLVLCAQKSARPIDSIGIDGWAVDYVWLDSESVPLRNPFCYRDPRTERSQQELWKRIPRDRIYSLTGIQMIRLNTLYQLYADQCEQLPLGERWLNLPEYFLHFLGGEPVAEYTNATHTQMVEAGSKRWCTDILDSAGLDIHLAPKIVPPGTVLGTLKGPLADLPQYRSAKLIAPACHDTACAVAAIGAEGEDWAFISSGTWSLVGSVLPEACVTAAACQNNFSNEGGLGGTVNFLKNVNGMWMIEECLRRWHEQQVNWKLEDLISACGRLEPPQYTLAVDEPELLLSHNMPERINSVLRKHGHAEIPTDPGMAPQVANLIFHSLAQRYAEILQQVTEVTGKSLRKVFIVGGGSKNEYLNHLLHARSGLDVIIGPVEASTIGNAAIQMAVLDSSVESAWGVQVSAVAEWSRTIAAPVAA
jgi:rhamnulokinase